MSITLLEGDCVAHMAAMAEASVDAVVCDPPYGLQFMGKEWDNLWRDKPGADAKWASEHAGTLAGRARRLPDYKATDPQAMQLWHEQWAREALRVLKPGGHLVAFNGSRTYHRMFCAIEDAGFEIRDCLSWLYGSGFPKSRNIGGGMGTALKPAWEPICLARKPLIGTVAANVLAHGTGAINVDACRVENDEYDPTKVQRQQSNRVTWEGGEASGFKAEHVQPTYNVAGRWPSRNSDSRKTQNVYGAMRRGSDAGAPRIDADKSAARFFYAAKAGKKDRAGSKHPTVKPVSLMRWLVRMVTPPGGLVLDPFAGSGTTGQAALDEGFDAFLIEREREYIVDIKARFGLERTLEDLLS